MPKRNKDACPCCGAEQDRPHDQDCALVAHLAASGNLECDHLNGNRLYLKGGILKWAPQSVDAAKLAKASAKVDQYRGGKVVDVCHQCGDSDGLPCSLSGCPNGTTLDAAATRTLRRLGYEYRGGEEWAPPLGKAPALDAPTLLDAAAGHMRDRAATYDQPGGERSMGRTVEAFNVITGRAGCDELVARALQKVRTELNLIGAQNNHNTHTIEVLQAVAIWLDQSLSQGKARVITESEGWLLMQILKDVRDRQREAPHRDSLEDGIAYAALKAEARLAE